MRRSTVLWVMLCAAGVAPAFAQNDTDLLGVKPEALPSDFKPQNPTGANAPSRPHPGVPPRQAQTGEPVDVVSGKMFRADVDLLDEGPLMTVSISRYYETANLEAGPLGWGWRHAFDRHVAPVGADTITRTDAHGSTVTYHLQAGKAQQGQRSLETLTSGGWRETDSDGAIYSYDGQGRLSSVRDRADNAIDLKYGGGGQLEEIVAPGDRHYQVQWADGRIAAVQAPGQRRVQYRYSQQGDLVEAIDPAGTSTLYGYDAAHRILSIGHPDARFVAFAYDAQGRVQFTQDARGARTSYAYDLANLTTTEEDPQGRKKVFVFDTAGRVVKQVDRAGGVSTWTYDDTGAIVGRSFPDGSTMAYKNDAQGRPVVVTDALGRDTRFRYDAKLGMPVSVIAPGNLETTIVYGACGQPVEVRGADGRVERAEYDSRGLLTKVIGPDGSTQTFTYDKAGHRTAWTHGDGRTTRYKIGPDGEIEREIQPDGRVQSYTYDRMGRVTSMIDPAGQKRSIQYGPNGLVQAYTDPAGRVTTYDYQSIAYAYRLAKLTPPDGKGLVFVYDDTGQLIGMKGPGLDRSFGRDGEGRVVSVSKEDGTKLVERLDAMGRVRAIGLGRRVDGQVVKDVHRFQYDALGRLVGETDGNGQLSYQYDEAGRMTQVGGADGRKATLEYNPAGDLIAYTNLLGQSFKMDVDALGRQTSQTWVQPGRTVSYRFTPSGSIAAVTDAAGRESAYEYDPKTEALVAIRGADGRTTRYAWNDLGALVAETDEAGRTTRFERDHEGRLTAKVDALGQRTSYAYDPLGRLSKVTAPEGTTTYERDAAGRMTLAENDQERIRYVYNAGQMTVRQIVTDKRLGRTLSAWMTYDDGGDLISLRLRFGEGPDEAQPEDRTIRYERDAQGRIVKLVGPDGKPIQFKHEPGRRLVQYPNGVTGVMKTDGWRPQRVAYVGVGSGATRPKLIDQAYEYDAAGQLTRMVTSDGATQLEYDKAGQLKSAQGPGIAEQYAYTPGGARDGGPGAADVLDGAGRVTRRERGGVLTELSYDSEGRVTQAAVGGRSVPWRHDPLGQCVGRGSDGYLYVLGQLVGHYTADGLAQVYATGDVEDETFAQYEGSASRPLYLHPDPAGTVLGATDAQGQVVDRFAYNPFGQPQGKGAIQRATLLGFQGRPFDAATGLYDFRARAYDPSAGRFTTPDALGKLATVDRYAFADSNPYWRKDPTGLFWQEAWDGTKYTGRQLRGFGVGVAQGAYGMVSGAVMMVVHPVQTAKGLGCLVRHPGLLGDAAHAYWNQLSNDAYNDPEAFARDMGNLTFNIDSLLIGGGGAAKGVSYVGKAARAPEIIAVTEEASEAAGVAGRVGEVAEEGSQAAKVGGEGAKIFHHTSLESMEKIQRSGEVWGSTEGRVYGTRLSHVDNTFNWDNVRLGHTPVKGTPAKVVFEGPAEQLFRPHETHGFYSFMKNKAGQYVSREVGYDVKFDPTKAVRRIGADGEEELVIRDAWLQKQTGTKYVWSHARHVGRIVGIDYGAPTALLATEGIH